MRDSAHIVLFYELVAATDIDPKRAQHPLTLAEIRFFPFLVLDINVESFAFKKQLQVCIVLQGRVACNLVEHLFQSLAARLDKIALEPANCLFVWRWRNHKARVVGV